RANSLFANYWAKVGPYYTTAYQEVWVSLGHHGILVLQIILGRKKAVKGSK
ncbi:hypothetical protein NQD34_015801, partial [Periophthalmus magnuspinnatus]